MNANEFRLGRKIKARREELGISLHGLANATQSSKGYLWEIENKDNANPSVNKLVRIAEALRIAPSSLLEDDEVAAQEPVAWAWEDELGCMHVHRSPRRPAWVDPGSANAIRAAKSLRPLYAAAQVPPCWTCFHCGETFTTSASAALHFGARQDAVPGCMARVPAGAEHGLLEALRKAEDECRHAWKAVQDESTSAHKEMAAMQLRHAAALAAAEELGYERGLREANRCEKPPT